MSKSSNCIMVIKEVKWRLTVKHSHTTNYKRKWNKVEHILNA